MKAIGSLIFAVASSIGMIVAAGSLASIVLANPETHTLFNLSGPDLWTTTPVKIDRSEQSYERLPAVLSTYAINAPKISVASPEKSYAAAPVEVEPTLSNDHLAWCAEKYRSFNPETNTYLSFSGQIRVCASPYGAQGLTAERNGSPEEKPIVSPEAQSIAAWCAARYKSYRPEDNTYQPYAGPRRSCEGPRPTDQIASSL